MIKVFRFLSHFVPKGYRGWVDENMRYAGLTINTSKFIGLIFLYGFSVGLVFATILYFLNNSFIWIPLGWIAGFSAVFALFNGIIVVIVDNRAKFVEEMLPDVLQLMSANLRSGLPPDRALLLSARSEFGFLGIEIKNVTKELFSGASIEVALGGLTYKIKSKILSTTVNLIIEGIEKGGELNKLLEQTAEYVRNTRILKKEIKAQVTAYTIFIFFATAIGAPFLYSISTFLAETMANLGKMINLESVVLPKTGFITFQKINIDPNFLNIYSMFALAITSLFGGIIIGLLLDGTEKSGIKYIPIMLLISVGIFLTAKSLISQILGIFPT